MKILLVGEFNRTHWNLKNALQSLGHEALVIGFTDGFKKVDVDIELKNPMNTWFLKKLRTFVFKTLNVDLLSFCLKKQIKKNKARLSGYDIVQFINDAPFYIARQDQIIIAKWLHSWNKKSFLLSTGTDYVSVSFANDKKYRYSILTPYFEGRLTKKDFHPALSYLSKEHKKLYDYFMSIVEGIISSDLDYHIPLIGHPKYLGMIPHSIDISKLDYQTPIITDKVIIFHGINLNNYYKKGNDIFEEALSIISQKYDDIVDIITVKNLKYEEYIKRFDKAHILLDQVYAYDQGYNALEAMAKGKVVFTGAEKEWLDYYNIEEDTIAINALPDAENIAKKLEWLILNPEKIKEISKNARAFVEEHHDHIKCAKQYLKKWS